MRQTSSDLAQVVAKAITARFCLDDLSSAERDRLGAIVCGRLHDERGHVRAQLLKPAFIDLEIICALQTVLQESALQRSRELLSTIKCGFEGLIADITAFFGTLEATEQRLKIASTAGSNRPTYRPTDTETAAAIISRLQTLVTERGWTLPVGVIRNIESGIVSVLTERFPNSITADFQTIVNVVRDRAIDLLQANGGHWPKGLKGSWYVKQIDELLTTHPSLFAAALIRN